MYHAAIEIDVVSATGTDALLTYVAKPHRVDDSLRPYTWYKEFVARGAEEHGLPPGYIAHLTAVEAVADPDHARAAKQQALLEG